MKRSTRFFVLMGLAVLALLIAAPVFALDLSVAGNILSGAQYDL